MCGCKYGKLSVVFSIQFLLFSTNNSSDPSTAFEQYAAYHTGESLPQPQMRMFVGSAALDAVAMVLAIKERCDSSRMAEVSRATSNHEWLQCARGDCGFCLCSDRRGKSEDVEYVHPSQTSAEARNANKNACNTF